MSVSILNYPAHLQEGPKLNRECLGSQGNQNEGQGNIPETLTKEMEELEDVFYQARDAYMKLYNESKQAERPLALQNFTFGNSRMYEMLDRLGNLQRRVK